MPFFNEQGFFFLACRGFPLSHQAMESMGKVTGHGWGGSTAWITHPHRSASVDISLCLQTHGTHTVWGNQLAVEVIFHGTTPEECSGGCLIHFRMFLFTYFSLVVVLLWNNLEDTKFQGSSTCQWQVALASPLVKGISEVKVATSSSCPFPSDVSSAQAALPHTGMSS